MTTSNCQKKKKPILKESFKNERIDETFFFFLSMRQNKNKIIRSARKKKKKKNLLSIPEGLCCYGRAFDNDPDKSIDLEEALRHQSVVVPFIFCLKIFIFFSFLDFHVTWLVVPLTKKRRKGQWNR